MKLLEEKDNERIGNSHALLVRMKGGTDTLQNSMAISYKN